MAEQNHLYLFRPMYRMNDSTFTTVNTVLVNFHTMSMVEFSPLCSLLYVVPLPRGFFSSLQTLATFLVVA